MSLPSLHLPYEARVVHVGSWNISQRSIRPISCSTLASCALRGWNGTGETSAPACTWVRRSQTYFSHLTHSLAWYRVCEGCVLDTVSGFEVAKKFVKEVTGWELQNDHELKKLVVVVVVCVFFFLCLPVCLPFQNLRAGHPPFYRMPVRHLCPTKPPKLLKGG